MRRFSFKKSAGRAQYVSVDCPHPSDRPPFLLAPLAPRHHYRMLLNHDPMMHGRPSHWNRAPFWISAAFVLLLSIIIIMMTDFGSLRPYQTTFFEGSGIIFESSETLENVWREGVWRKVDGASEERLTQLSEGEAQKSERRI